MYTSLTQALNFITGRVHGMEHTVLLFTNVERMQIHVALDVPIKRFCDDAVIIWFIGCACCNCL